MKGLGGRYIDPRCALRVVREHLDTRSDLHLLPTTLTQREVFQADEFKDYSQVAALHCKFLQLRPEDKPMQIANHLGVKKRYWPTYNNNKNDCDCSALEDENNRLKRSLEDKERERKQEWEERLEEAKQAASDRSRSADTWEQAFSRQAFLYEREARSYPELDENGLDSFAVGASSCLEALEIWREEEAKVKAQIEQLQAQIRLNTISRLRGKYQDTQKGKYVEQCVIYGLENQTPSSWLDW